MVTPTTPTFKQDSQKGFTLVELMVTVAIIGVLGTAAVVSVDPGRTTKSTRGFAESIAAQIELSRQRATATMKQQQVDIRADQVLLWQAAAEGISYTVAWEANPSFTTRAPRDISVYSVYPTAVLQAGSVTPTANANLPYSLVAMPNGRIRNASGSYYAYYNNSSATIYLENTVTNQRARIVVFGMTGATTVFDGW